MKLIIYIIKIILMKILKIHVNVVNDYFHLIN